MESSMWLCMHGNLFCMTATHENGYKWIILDCADSNCWTDCADSNWWTEPAGDWATLFLHRTWRQQLPRVIASLPWEDGHISRCFSYAWEISDFIKIHRNIYTITKPKCLRVFYISEICWMMLILSSEALMSFKLSPYVQSCTVKNSFRITWLKVWPELLENSPEGRQNCGSAELFRSGG